MPETRDWTNLAEDGRRFAKCIRMIETTLENNKNMDHAIKMNYLATMDKLTNTKIKLVEVVFGIKTSIKRAKEQGLWVENPPPKTTD